MIFFTVLVLVIGVQIIYTKVGLLKGISLKIINLGGLKSNMYLELRMNVSLKIVLEAAKQSFKKLMEIY